MTPRGETARQDRALRGLHAPLLVLALILLIAGFPFFLFGLFLATSPQNGLAGDVALGLSVGGLVAVLCAVGIREHLQRRDGWF